MKLIVTCIPNAASMNMRKVLLEKYPFRESKEKFEGNPIYVFNEYKLITSKKNVLELDHLKEHFKPEVYIICSTHSAKEHNKTITLHPTGNWGPANFGGKEKELSPVPAGFMHNCLKKLKELVKERNSKYQVTYEVTHHGPSGMNAPLVFVEVGSSKKEWEDMQAIGIVTESLFSDITSDKPSAFCVGGTHYSPKFSQDKIAEEFAIGHTCPKYAIGYLDKVMFREAINQSVPKASVVLIDWKGLKAEDRKKVISFAEDCGIKTKKI